MGIVGVLLAGGCPFPTDQAAATIPSAGARVTVGSLAPTAGTGKNNGKGQGARVAAPGGAGKVRVLVVAPSNAAVDELVLRLCQDGVPGADGGVFFPKVVRVGAPRGDQEADPDGGGGGGGAFRQVSSSPAVQVLCVCYNLSSGG